MMKKDLFGGNKLAHTYSIVARDPATGEMGAAAQSHWFAVGATVSWAEAGVGAIVTQAMANVSFGPRGLDLLKQGQTAPEVLAELLKADDGRDLRQVAIVDTQGRVAAHTGQKCMAAAGHYAGDNFSVQANMMLRDTVWPAMVHAFEQSRGPLAERMVTALEAAEAEGGDIRGKQSAAILVVKGQSTGEIWADRLIDLRVEDHPEPALELKRLLRIFRAYEYMNQGDLTLEKNDTDGAFKAYSAAEAMAPDNLEIKFWHAISLANLNRLAEALPIFQEVFAQNDQWAMLIERLPPTGTLKMSQEDLARILAERVHR
jgi:uncharacterized Ntn-hydrolase superfamily protein